jgi:RNA polymerase sigma-70 factor, ECF subfamily
MTANTVADATNGSTPSSMILGIRQRDPAAWRRLHALFAPLIYCSCRRKGLQASDAADVVQDVLRAVLTNIDGFRRDQAGSSFHGWIWTITHSRLMDFFRQQARRRTVTGAELADPASSPIPEEDPPADWPGELVRRLVQQLQTEFNAASWQAFWRMVVGGEPASAIASDLSISVAAVRQAKYRVLQRLRLEWLELAGSESKEI